MQSVRNYTILIWAVVALLVLNLSTFGTIFYQKYKNDQLLATKIPDVVPFQQGQNPLTGNYFIDRLGFSPDQIAEFQEFNYEFREEAMEVNMNLSAFRNEMLEELKKHDIDTATLNRLSDEIGYEHSILKKLTYKYYLDIKEICNPSQRELLDAAFSETILDDRNPGYRGGGPRMRGRGRHRGWN